MADKQTPQQLLGIGLNVDQDFLADITRKTITAAVVNALEQGEKDSVTQGIVNAVLNIQVTKSDGNVASDYDIRNGRSESLMTHYVRKTITDLFKEELKRTLESKREELRARLVKAICSKKNQDNLADSFIAGMIENSKYLYNTDVKIEFTQQEK